MPHSILIVEDDLTFATMLKTWLGKKGFSVDTASSNARARKQLDAQPYDLVLSDSWMKEQKYNIPLIIMTGYADIQSAVQAIKHGASDYISKPIQPDELLKKINEALQNKALPTPVGIEKNTVAPKASKNKAVPHSATVPPSNFLEGESEAARQLYNYVGLVAPTPMSVLINCASGTGAFVEANGGTLFLDEIGNLSYEVQIQLLRALQERRIRPVGSNKEIEVDVRLVSATNENLQQAIEKGNFREDLYHRINEFTLRMPALKERQEDILLFANFFLDQANRELDRQLIGFDTAASQALQTYSWPGNLRQLKNIVKRATLLAQSNFITLAELGYELQEPIRSAGPQTFSLHDEAAEKKRILEALKQTGNNKSKAAILLGIDRKTLYNKLKLYDIQ